MQQKVGNKISTDAYIVIINLFSGNQTLEGGGQITKNGRVVFREKTRKKGWRAVWSNTREFWRRLVQV